MFSGLFRGAMTESATALSPWAYQRNVTKISYYLMTLLNSGFNKKHASSSEILKYLRTAPAKNIDKASFDIYLMVGFINIQYILDLTFNAALTGFPILFPNSTRLFFCPYYRT